MLRFFRQIRKKLMEQNKTRTYIFYAIGEIALVMIGILLALQVNNWNESRKILQEEQYLLKELNKEFSINLSLIERDIDGNINNRNATNELMEMFHGGVENFNVKKMDSLLINVFSATSYDPSTGVVEEIISSSKLRLLQDDSLRYMISQWPSVLKDQAEDIRIRATHFEEFLLPAVMKAVPFKNSNPYVNFDFWAENYERATLSPSAFETRPENFVTSEMESLLFTNSMNQDFIIMNDLNTKAFIENILAQIQLNLKP